MKGWQQSLKKPKLFGAHTCSPPTPVDLEAVPEETKVAPESRTEATTVRAEAASEPMTETALEEAETVTEPLASAAPRGCL